MLGSITPLGEQGRGSRWWLTAGSYAVACGLGGLVVGAAAGLVGAGLGAAGLDLPPEGALLVVAVAALLGLAADARLLGLRLPTLRRQVDEGWIGRYRGWVVGVGFGFQLGLAFCSATTAYPQILRRTCWRDAGVRAVLVTPKLNGQGGAMRLAPRTAGLALRTFADGTLTSAWRSPEGVGVSIEVLP